MTFLGLSVRWRSGLLVLLILAGATLIWGKSLSGPYDVRTGRNEREHTGSREAREASVELSEKQAATLLRGRVAVHEFQMFNTAVGTIDFNEDMLVQVFSQYPGRS